MVRMEKGWGALAEIQEAPSLPRTQRFLLQDHEHRVY